MPPRKPMELGTSNGRYHQVKPQRMPCELADMVVKASRLKKDTTNSEVGDVVDAFGADPSARTNYQEPS